MTLEEAQADLVTINAAISEYLTGKRRRTLKVGGKEFNRELGFADIKYSDLTAERTRLEGIISSLSSTTITPRFRQNTTFPLNVTSKPV
jgi:hypothetical protein